MKQVKQITTWTRLCTRVGLITHRKLSKQCCFVLQQVRGRDNLNKHSNLVCFPKVRTGQPDHGWTCHFENEIGFFQELLRKNDFLRAYYLEFDWSGWISLQRECAGRPVLTNGKRPNSLRREKDFIHNTVVHESVVEESKKSWLKCAYAC